VPSFPIIDSHVHLYDVSKLPYSWLKARPLIDRSFLVEDYRVATSGFPVELLVFAEVWVDDGFQLDEARWVSMEAARDPLIAGMIAAAPLERGVDIMSDIEALRGLPTFRAIRRITEAETDPEYCLRPDFVAAVEVLGEQGIVCDMCVFHHQLGGVVELAKRCPQTRIVLDHMGKPPIRDGNSYHWKENIRQLAALPNVVCKVSGILTEADQANWTQDTLRPYLDHAIESFGFDRVMFGSDWPVLSMTATFQRWVEIVDWTLEGCTPAEKHKFYRDTAVLTYRL
jgi:L-fuconolactonase